MGNQKNICTAVLAHVDAGKTTLSEAMLYLSGNIRKAGRVDNGDAFLDMYALERARGITIFSKQAVIRLPEAVLTLLDTPGHVDLSAEMERALQVLDYAILVVSGADGVQEHTKTLWRLLRRYEIPVFIFINKMDQPGTDRERLLLELQKVLDENCIDFSNQKTDEFYESVAMCEETVLEKYLETGVVEEQAVAELIAARRMFPCFFGSALKMEGVTEFLDSFVKLVKEPEYPREFGAKVFKIARDEQGNRLTYLKITGGKFVVKQVLSGKKKSLSEEADTIWEEKVNQIRIYSGEKYETADELKAGCVCAVTGLNHTYPGQGLGVEAASEMPVLEPVLNYEILLPQEINPAVMLPKLRMLEEEEPELHIVWDEKLREIQVQLMGEVQIEVLKSRIKEQFDIDVEFGDGHVVYKETIADVVEGVGHFEPLRHYAEVHLKLEPGEPGSGMVFAASCSEDVLDKNWQRLILTHLQEREHIGVLTGAAITDMKITLVSGRAHLKHTEGGDFRQATYRAVRQGLMQAESVLLEPYYDFILEVPESAVGRAMMDIERMHGTIAYDADWEDEAKNAAGMAEGMRRLTGHAPVAAMKNYQKELISYTKGQGRLTTTNKGYLPCHNTDEVVAATGYEPERDLEHTPDSVFCAHGAGFVVPWNEVPNYMHLPSCLEAFSEAEEFSPDKVLPEARRSRLVSEEEVWLGTEEIDKILEQTYHANKRGSASDGKKGWKLRKHEKAYAAPVVKNYQPKPRAEEYLLVDGYNIIFAWQDLKELAAINIDGARGKLLDILCNYQGIRQCHLIVVFDAYRVAGHQTEIFDYHNIHVVYTKEAETADQYIEKFAHEHGRRYNVTVATSDGLEQIIIRGAGCSLISARELEQEVAEKNAALLKNYQDNNEKSRNYLLDGMHIL